MAKTRSLKQIIFILISLSVVIVLSMIFCLTYLQQQIYLKGEFLKRGITLTRNLVYNSRKPLKFGNNDKIQELTDILMKEKGIRWVSVLNSQGGTVLEKVPETIHWEQGQLNQSQSGNPFWIRAYRLSGGESIYDIQMDVMARNEGSASELELLGEGIGGAQGTKETEVRVGTIHVGMSLEELRVTQQKIVAQLLLIFLILLALGMLAGTYFSRLLLGPINQLVAAMKDIASRKADLTRRISVHRQDELGELTRWFDTFVENLQKIVGNTINLIDQMTTSLEELSSTAEELNSTADEINSTVQNFTHDLQRQEEETAVTTSTTERVAGTLLEITGQAEGASRFFEETQTVSQQGGETVQQSVTKINGIAESMNTIEERMKHLSRSLEAIAGFVETIQGIASQTNLLSLNAAIEAARAGEAGRGFSVVAEEVRKLAENASHASREIQALITQIQGETRDTLEATREGGKAVQDGRNTIHQAGSSLEEIMRTANQSAMLSEKISKSLGQQSDILKEMMERVRQVQVLGKNNFVSGQTMAASVEEQTASLEQVTTSIQRLAEDALKVKSMVVTFKVK